MSSSNASPRSIGRPRGFDRDEVLLKVVEVFWRLGYNETSYRELEAATGEGRQSLVHAFGDKAAMFELALRRYIDSRVNEVIEMLRGSGTASQRVRRVFARWEADARADDQRGCLLINTGGEIGPKNAAIAAVMADSTRRLVSEFAKTFQRAMDAGEMDQSLSAKSLARLTVAAGDGALLHSRVSGNAASTKQTLLTLRTLLFGS
ncbi:TetR/AcrR family transcriptional regulator [Rhodopirellula sp. JC740]|uniref:TetR/AcrR family transcriptional regulator n=1 Tax=Rhodopirellula halodulae TaxID=2894198 RepID=A0ABS8NE23_9BACT|nr:TetR/AcrR family transcriptional regulator [Rhodopirellula sp. JC740]MCC9641083.1 TetR/AcrR family transcriptional regulator [Rhodopirellula sp. JC740]